MDKIKVVISAPVDTYSGYGARSRDIVQSLLKLEKYDVKILSQRWGNTTTGFLKDHNLSDIAACIIPQLYEKPDVWIQVTVPNEFQKVGKYNIGMTAGIETTLTSLPWVEGCNRMDLILVSSEHSKNTFKQTILTQKDPAGNVIKEVKVTTPIEVLFEGIDLSKYFITKSNFDLSSINEEFCYLFVGHWLKGDHGHDRKNISYLIKAFLETFKNKQKQPALLLKIGLGASSILHQNLMLNKIEAVRSTVKGKLPNIYLLDGDLSDEEMNSLYNHSKVKAMVSFTKGEGFGRPLLEFSAINKPIIASGWSGHLDFLDKEFTTLVGGKLEHVHPSAVQKDVIIAESMWFDPDDTQVGRVLTEMYKNYKSMIVPAKRQGHKSRTEFSLDKMTEKLGSILDSTLPAFPKQLDITLPKLKLPKLNKI